MSQPRAPGEVLAAVFRRTDLPPGRLEGVTSDAIVPGDNADPFLNEPTVRDEAPQFVLPLVVRIERDAPRPEPTRWRPPLGPY